MRKCSKCKVEKSLNEFYVSTNKIGLQNYCKDCIKVYNSDRPLIRREIVRKSIQRPEEKKRRAVYMSKWFKNNKDKAKEIREKYPEKNEARAIFKKALNKGDIIKLPCEVCGEQKSEGHHCDYSKPLDVLWLCRQHHRIEHRL